MICVYSSKCNLKNCEFLWFKILCWKLVHLIFQCFTTSVCAWCNLYLRLLTILYAKPFHVRHYKDFVLDYNRSIRAIHRKWLRLDNRLDWHGHVQIDRCIIVCSNHWLNHQMSATQFAELVQQVNRLSIRSIYIWWNEWWVWDHVMSKNDGLENVKNRNYYLGSIESKV